MAFTLLASEIGISLKHTSQETLSGSVGFFCSVILTPLWDLGWLGYFLAKGAIGRCLLAMLLSAVGLLPSYPMIHPFLQ